MPGCSGNEESTGYVAFLDSLKSYFDENMALLKMENSDALFDGNPIYTKVRDDNPTRYTPTARVKNVMAADGCVIEGTVENCVLFRGVKVAKGAVVKNCILMQDTIIAENTTAEYLITDKNVYRKAKNRIIFYRTKVCFAFSAPISFYCSAAFVPRALTAHPCTKCCCLIGNSYQTTKNARCQRQRAFFIVTSISYVIQYQI